MARLAIALIVGASTLLHAQANPVAPPAQLGTGRFDSGIVVGGDWLQANALPMERDALESVDGSVSWRRQRWAIDGGWLRVARTLSTVQGGTVTGGPLLGWRRVLFLPSIGLLYGQAQASRDTTGFDFVTSANTTGHTARFTHSTAASTGAGVGLTIELPLYGPVAFRAHGSRWYFTGAPLEGDRSRSLVGAGLSWRVRE